MKVPPASLVLILLAAKIPALGQSVPPNAPVPPGYTPPPPTIYVPPYPGRVPAPPVDPAALQREARELLDLSQSVQPDIESLRRGLFSKNLVDKLKRIEKLSKRLRAEIAPLGN
ncbi:MAG: hypothetical protein WBX03_06560 [Terriglobales bacterium]|jgi:hypothetical protein